MSQDFKGNKCKKSDIELTDNTNDSGFQTTDSKAKLVYLKFKEKRSNFSDFLCWLGIFLTSLASLLTSEFKPIFGIDNSNHYLFAFFVFVCLASFVLSIYFLIKWILNRKKYNENTFIEYLKGKK